MNVNWMFLKVRMGRLSAYEGLKLLPWGKIAEVITFIYGPYITEGNSQVSLPTYRIFA